MTPLHPDQWLDVIDREYLRSFVKDGGSAVKFAACFDKSSFKHVDQRLGEHGATAGYLVARADSRKRKISSIDDVFFALASSVNWNEFSERLILNLAFTKGYRSPEKSPGSLSARLAAANGVEPTVIGLEVRQLLATHVFRHKLVPRDLRVAMLQLALAVWSGGAESEEASSKIGDWLTGANRSVTPVKQYQIRTRISRSNARYFLSGFSHLLRLSGWSGFLLIIDGRQLANSRRQTGSDLHYTKAAVLDSYEVARQFVDGIDKMDGALVAYLLERSFIEDSARGLGAYPALEYRIVDEVRDPMNPNPLSALTALSLEAADV
ncbi:MAG: hypothetical protein JW395_2138 [Nitrospira sp.]|nr:hypothetical protein [Nitrospira sp.]